MIPEFRIKYRRGGHLMPVLLLLGFMFSANVLAADKYRVFTQFISLGEVIAKPVLEVTEGETVGGTYSVTGDAQYKVVILLRNVADNEVMVSLQFTSGNIDIQPNVLVELDEEFTGTFDDKVIMKLLVQKIPQEFKSPPTK